MNDYEKGFCDSCGEWSSKLLLDDIVGWYKCRKCEAATEREVARAYAERASLHNGVAILYPDERGY